MWHVGHALGDSEKRSCGLTLKHARRDVETGVPALAAGVGVREVDGIDGVDLVDDRRCLRDGARVVGGGSVYEHTQRKRSKGEIEVQAGRGEGGGGDGARVDEGVSAG